MSLILTRKEGERIIINGNIEIMIYGINGRQVRLGINAPKNISVHREEVYKRLLSEKKTVNEINNFNE